jgi:hypothetical protein
MNFVAFVAAVMILTADTNDSGRYRDTQVSAAIEYRAVDRAGNELFLSVRSGDPYFGRYYGDEFFYYNDCRYYRYYPTRRVVVRQPVYVVHDPVYVVRSRYDEAYWKALREREKRFAKAYSKARKEDAKNWGRFNGRTLSASSHGKGKGKSKGKKH